MMMHKIFWTIIFLPLAGARYSDELEDKISHLSWAKKANNPRRSATYVTTRTTTVSTKVSRIGTTAASSLMSWNKEANSPRRWTAHVTTSATTVTTKVSRASTRTASSLMSIPPSNSSPFYGREKMSYARTKKEEEEKEQHFDKSTLPRTSYESHHKKTISERRDERQNGQTYQYKRTDDNVSGRMLKPQHTSSQNDEKSKKDDKHYYGSCEKEKKKVDDILRMCEKLVRDAFEKETAHIQKERGLSKQVQITI